MIKLPIVACVLRSGGEYEPRHVQNLYDGVRMHWLPHEPLRFICLTDIPFHIKGVQLKALDYGWPGWWSKMELFRPDFRWDRILYFDLDTLIIGGLQDIAVVSQLTLLRDFYRSSGLGSGMMMLPQKERNMTWDEWRIDPGGHMRRAGRGGDQRFMETLWLTRAQRWQDALPAQVVSYKVDVAKNNDVAPRGARVVCFHGKPRPWNNTVKVLHP